VVELGEEVEEGEDDAVGCGVGCGVVIGIVFDGPAQATALWPPQESSKGAAKPGEDAERYRP
jgi:hypothetical protein